MITALHPCLMTLPQIRAIAVAAGCTEAEFGAAVAAVGTDPEAIAAYLRRACLKWRLPISSPYDQQPKEA
jgi:Protein of unknown function (DUF3606)